MDLLEYKARELFYNGGIPTVVGDVFDDVESIAAAADSIEYPVVVKAQVGIGGRGKAGGIKFAENAKQLVEAGKNILGMDIRGHLVKKIMVVKKVEVADELYLSIMLDRNSKKHILIFSPCGGMDIEQTAKENPEQIYKMEIDPLLGLSPYYAAYLGDKAGLNKEQKKQFSHLLSTLYKLCLDKDCMLAEINPLAITPEGNLMAIDAKVSIDDAGVPRIPELLEYRQSMPVEPLVAEAAKFGFLYIPCDADGDIVVMSNGSGMLMSCIDHITKRGMKVSAVLDLGGGAVAEKIKEAVRILFLNNAQCLFINIFGGITRCNEVASGIRMACEEYGIDKPIVARFEGTNKDIGLEIIKGLDNVSYADGLLEGVDAIERWKKQ